MSQQSEHKLKDELEELMEEKQTVQSRQACSRSRKNGIRSSGLDSRLRQMGIFDALCRPTRTRQRSGCRERRRPFGQRTVIAFGNDRHVDMKR